MHTHSPLQAARAIWSPVWGENSTSAPQCALGESEGGDIPAMACAELAGDTYTPCSEGLARERCSQTAGRALGSPPHQPDSALSHQSCRCFSAPSPKGTALRLAAFKRKKARVVSRQGKDLMTQIFCAAEQSEWRIKSRDPGLELPPGRDPSSPLALLSILEDGSRRPSCTPIGRVRMERPGRKDPQKQARTREHTDLQGRGSWGGVKLASSPPHLHCQAGLVWGRLLGPT